MTRVPFEDPSHSIGSLQNKEFFLKQLSVVDYLKRTGLRGRYLAGGSFRRFVWATPEESISSSRLSQDFNAQQNLPDFLLGWSENNDGDIPSWPDLPRLKTLCADTNWIFLRVHYKLLSLLSSMVSLNLEDKRSRYSLADVVH
ncbi:hypothetical protein BGX24_006420 [Mortierella sp. AD032]|nr:hypothetical protein BGX24_006420 [Mortierella sp. AD032]